MRVILAKVKLETPTVRPEVGIKEQKRAKLLALVVWMLDWFSSPFKVKIKQMPKC